MRSFSVRTESPNLRLVGIFRYQVQLLLTLDQRLRVVSAPGTDAPHLHAVDWRVHQLLDEHFHAFLGFPGPFLKQLPRQPVYTF